MSSISADILSDSDTDEENEEMVDHVIGKLAEIKTMKKEKTE